MLETLNDCYLKRFHCLDKETICDEALIDENVWPQEDLDSDSEVKLKKRKMLEGLNGDQLVSLQQGFPQLPVNEKNQRKRRKSYKKGGRNLRGVYEQLPEGSSIEKTSNEVATLRIPGLPAAKLLKSDLSNYGTVRQCPSALDLLRPREQSTDANVNSALVERIRSHAKSSRRKLTGEKLIRKSSQTAEDKNPLKANLVKVCRIKVSERREFTCSPRKKSFDNDVASPSKRRRNDSSDDSYLPDELSEEVAVEGPRKSDRPSKPVIRYGESASEDPAEDPAEVQPAPTASTSAIVNALPAELTANTSAIVDALNDSTLPQLSLDNTTLNITECCGEVLSPKTCETCFIIFISQTTYFINLDLIVSLFAFVLGVINYDLIISLFSFILRVITFNSILLISRIFFPIVRRLLGIFKRRIRDVGNLQKLN